MLTIDDILYFLNNSQEKLNHLYKYNDDLPLQFLNNNFNKTNPLPEELVDRYKDFVDYYYVYNDDKHSFIYSVLYCVDKDFVLNLHKDKYIINLRKKLCYDLDNKNLYREFNYVKSRIMKKDKMNKILMNFNQSVDQNTMQYIVDYFGINVYIFSVSDDDKTLVDFSSIMSYNDTDESNPYKPSLILFNKNGTYMPILHKYFGGVLIYSNIGLIDKLYQKSLSTNNQNKKINQKNKNKNIGSIKSDNKSENEQKNKPEIKIEEKVGDIKLKSIKSMLLKDLQTIASEHGISIMKKAAKNNREIPRTKNELYQDIQNIMKSI